MNKVLLSLFITILSLSTYAEVSLGINLSSNLSTRTNQTGSSSQTSATGYALGIQPTVLILVNNFIEIAPFGGFSFSHSVNYSNETQTSDYTSFGYNVGCGIYFHVAGNDIIRFSLGPQISYAMAFPQDSDQYSFFPALKLPANIDLQFNRHFFVRMSPVLAEIVYNYQHNGENRYNSSFQFNVITQTGASLGFFFTF